jgi:hypothetical protein
MNSLREIFNRFKRAVDLFLVLILVLLAFYFGTNVFTPVRFDREKIEVWVTEGQIQVRGLYHYRNRSPLPLSFSLGLPFPVDETHQAPAIFSISEVLADGSTSKEIPPRDYHGDVVFRVWFAPKQEKWIRVDYVQHVLQPNGRYILLTTRKWNRPLEFGEYIFHLSADFELAASNYALQAEPEGQQRRYSFVRSDFYPSADWEFSWRTSKPLLAYRGTSR